MTNEQNAAEELRAYKQLFHGALLHTCLFDLEVEITSSRVWIQDRIQSLMQSCINSGAFADADVGDETINAICAEWGVQPATQLWLQNMEEDLAQNRRFLAGREQETHES